MIKCNECGSDNVYAHREVTEVYRFRVADGHIILEDIPKHIVEELISFYCHKCDNEVVLTREDYQSTCFEAELKAPFISDTVN
jgi:hypothetical protein